MPLRPLPLGLKLGLSIGFLVGLVFAGWAPPDSFWPRFLFASLFIILLCGIAGWVMIDRPIRELIKVMEKGERYNFLHRASVRSRDLLGQLATSFNRLLERITTLDAFKLESERELIMAQEELKYKRALEDKTTIIESTNRDLEKRLQELDLINQLALKIVSTLDLEELYQTLDELLGEKLGFKEYALLLRDEENEEVVVQVARGFADSSRLKGMRFRADEGLTGHVLRTREVGYLPDTRGEPRYLYYKGEKKEDGSFLSIPLLFKDQVVGILNFTRPGVNSFSSQEIQFLKTIASQLAVALMNGRLYRRTRELAVRDDLTQLYNRRHFQAIFPLEMKRAERFHQPVSLLMIDIDQFKKYNDTNGHLEGDERLRELAGLFTSKIREVDFVARVGGEEFVIFLPNTSKKDACSVADKLRLLVRSFPFRRNPPTEEHPFTVSIGVAAFPDDGDRPAELLAAADAALYQAKNLGRDRIVAATPFHEERRLPSSNPPSTVFSSRGF